MIMYLCGLFALIGCMTYTSHKYRKIEKRLDELARPEFNKIEAAAERHQKFRSDPPKTRPIAQPARVGNH